MPTWLSDLVVRDELGLPGSTVAGLAAVVVAATASPSWRLLRGAVTVAHELGHAVAAWSVGARVSGIELHLSSSGVTQWSFAGNPGRLRRAWIAWWGYPAPVVVAACGAALAAAGLSRAWVAALAVVAAATLLWVRNIWAVLVCVSTAAGLGWAALAGPGPALAANVATTALLAAGGVRTVAEHVLSGGDGGDPASDSAVVAAAVFVPAVLVRLSFVVACSAAVAAGYAAVG